MSNITDEIRQEAIFILQLAISNYMTTWDAARLLDATEEAMNLAAVAFDAAHGKVPWENYNIFLQAEALLRDGWSPGDEVEKL